MKQIRKHAKSIAKKNPLLIRQSVQDKDKQRQGKFKN